jgi:hypothetical protein
VGLTARIPFSTSHDDGRIVAEALSRQAFKSHRG